MRRIVIDKPGSYDRLRLLESAAPGPGSGEVRIAVEYAGVNYADCVTRMGLYASAREFAGYPMTPGFEVAGRIDAVGTDVDGFREGDAVLALTLFDGYTDHLCLPAGQVFHLPRDMNTREAASIPTAFLTAWYGLCRLARITAEQAVLVHSAAGGVGGALVQIGALEGARVTGVVGAPHKVEVAAGLGAGLVIDKSTVAPGPALTAAAPGGFDIVLDANGAETLRDSYRRLKPGGHLVIYGFHTMLPKSGGRPNWLKLARDWLRTPRFNPLRMTMENRTVSGFNLSFMTGQRTVLTEGMTWLLDRFADGRLRPPGTAVYPLHEAGRAHAALESGETTGKLILRCTGRAERA